MKVFLTGATGYIGSSVAERLRQSGHTVLGLARSGAAAEKLTARGIMPQAGDLLDRAALTAAASAADAVIHAASTNDAGAPAADLSAVEALLEVLRGGNKPLIYTSGVWILGNTGNQSGDEDIPLDPLPTVAWRVPVERLILTSAAQQVRSAIIRPAIVYGRAGGIPAMMLAGARSHGVVQYVGDGAQRWPTVHIDDLADLYLRVLTGGGAGTLWHAAHGPSTPAREIAVAVSQVAGLGGKAESWPVGEARRTLGSLADAMALDQQMSGKRAERLLGWKPVGRSVLEEIIRGSYAD
ncbi:MAG: NAD-dependent epimerase/dehydratase family protein [Gemmatimonadota bacterium]